MSEQLLALEAWKNAMTSYTDDLFLGAQEAYSALWPGQRMPTDPADLGNDLQLAKVHLREWRDSGARVGADEALSYFLSWYEKADLETLRTVHEGSIWTTDLEHIQHRRELAHNYVDYANTDTFVRDICEPEKKKDDVKVAADAEGSDSSQDEEEADEADTDILEQGSVPGGGDGSIPSAGSGTPEADITTATAPPAGGSASATAPCLCSIKNFKLYQIPGMPGAIVRYTFNFPSVCYLNKF
jgi:hypothetical protein